MDWDVGNTPPSFHSLSMQTSSLPQAHGSISSYAALKQLPKAGLHPRVTPAEAIHASGMHAHSTGDIFMLEQREEFVLSPCSS